MCFFPKCYLCVLDHETLLFVSLAALCCHGPQGFCFLGLLWLYTTQSFTHFLVGVVNFFPVFPSILLYNAWQKAHQSASTRGGPHHSGSMWLTSINAFQEFTSSALSVRSSRLSLIVTSSAFFTMKFFLNSPANTSRLDVSPHQKIVAVLFQVQIITKPFVNTRIDVVLLGEKHICHELVA